MNKKDDRSGVKNKKFKTMETPRNMGDIFLQTNDMLAPIQAALKGIETPRNMGDIFLQTNDMLAPIQAALKGIETPRKMEGIFLQTNDMLAPIQAALKGIETPRNMGDIFLQTNDMLAPIQAALKGIEIPRNTGQIFKQPVEVIESTLSSSFNQMDVVSSKQYYEELSSVIRETNLDEALIEGDNVINVISDSQFKNVCYRLTVGILIIALSSALTDEEIKGVWDSLVYLIALASGIKTLKPAPVQKVEYHHHHHHHYHHDDE
ncbi:hypothetical protein [Bacillus thuringiensis]|uniref:hypothetical protein n=1 Tax=Bacillus thuringiensis TaxID=1428 RepID=UPI0009779108|nr:hypothetical protein [Bacillus thuringiensis]OMH30734.1 hypothetical protein BUM91_15115 [Bacillus thuringiensis]